jgi:hypothetical protein
MLRGDSLREGLYYRTGTSWMMVVMQDVDPYMSEPVREVPLLDRLGVRPRSMRETDDYEPVKWRRSRVRVDTSDD